MLDVIAQFEVPWSDYIPLLVRGVRRTLMYAAVGFAGGATLGAGLALLRVSTIRPLRWLAAAYTEIFKNIPLLAVIFVVHFGLPSVGVIFTPFQSGALSLTIFYGAYLSEIFRAAILGVHGGQKEAAQALGLGRLSTLVKVTFPQALRIALPGTNTMAVDLLKSTSLLVTISAMELMTAGRIITSTTFRALEVYLVIAAIYFAMAYPLSQALLWLERQIAAGNPVTPRRRRRLKAARAMFEAELGDLQKSEALA
jgi:polar amino acid transport system permease protein